MPASPPDAPIEPAQLDALRLANRLRERLVDFSTEDHAIREPAVMEACRSFWSGEPSRGGLVSELWVEGAFPPKGGDTTTDHLVAAGLLPSRLRDHLDGNGQWPADRRLFTHQADAISAVKRGTDDDRPAVVVTAPTGGGKTESFLFPALGDLLDHPRPPGERGVRCLLLYPMNALVNDQVERISEYLAADKGGLGLRLFHFTGETPEAYNDKSREVLLYPEHRVQTRQEARGLEGRFNGSNKPAKFDGDNPRRPHAPDIVVTNYSMLSYMLCRPQDDWFFGPALRSIVLDEAHLYTGTLAAEITLLLRRVLLRCDRTPEQVLQLATSATLGGDADDLRTFSAALFGKRQERVSVVRGERERRSHLIHDEGEPTASPDAAAITSRSWPLGPTLALNEGRPQLVEDAEACRQLRQALLAIVPQNVVEQAPEELVPARLLWQTLTRCPLIRRLEALLWQPHHNAPGPGDIPLEGNAASARPLSELCCALFGSDTPEGRKATIELLRLGAMARNEADQLPLLPHRLHLQVRAAGGVHVCLNPRCSGDGPRIGGGGVLLPGHADRCTACGGIVAALWRCRECGRPRLALVQSTTRGRPYLPAKATDRWMADDDDTGGDAVEFFHLPGEANDGHAKLHLQDDATRCGGSSAHVSLTRSEACDGCGAKAGAARPLSSATSLALSVAAVPPLPGMDNARLPARGRRMLTFSDSRAEAARLGPLLTEQHEAQLVRAALMDALPDAASSAATAMLEQEQQELQAKLDAATDDAVRRLLERKLEQTRTDLAGYEVGLPVGDLSKRMADQPAYAELLHRGSSEQHHADRWSHDKWKENHRGVRQEARARLAWELIRPFRGRQANLESLCLVEVTYPALHRVELLDAASTGWPEAVADTMRQAWVPLLASLLDSARVNGGITTGDDETDWKLRGKGVPVLGHHFTKNREGDGVFKFIRGRRIDMVAAVLKAAGLVSHNQEMEHHAKGLLAAAFDALHETGDELPWLQASVGDDAMRIDFSRLAVRRTATPHRCTATGKALPRAIAGVSPLYPHPAAETVSHDVLDADPGLGRLRRAYTNREGEGREFREGLWGEEHSAQLHPGENRRLQNLFRRGIRNVLSSTTTMELGIDIGGLNCVLMGNSPPGVANYMQRAGRAGRRSDGSSAVITYSRARPFDLAVFNGFGQYLSRPMRRPTVFLDRPRLIGRHIHALLLGEFFKAVGAQPDRTGAMDAYEKMGRFCGVDTTPRWEQGKAKPQPLPADPWRRHDQPLPTWAASGNASLSKSFCEWLSILADEPDEATQLLVRSLVHGTTLESTSADWRELVGSVLNRFTDSIEWWQRAYEAGLQAWHAAGHRDQANAIGHGLNELLQWTVIAYLGDKQFLPGFGFPINVLKLYVPVSVKRAGRSSKVEDSKSYDLSRGGLLGVAEYAPGCRLLAGGRVIRSHGLRKTWHGGDDHANFGVNSHYAICEKGHFTHDLQDLSECRCGSDFIGSVRHAILVEHGFSSAAWDPPEAGSEAVRIAATRQEVLASDDDATQVVDDFADIAGLRAACCEGGDILVLNEGGGGKGFAVCTACGYADSETEFAPAGTRQALTKAFADHRPLDQPVGNIRRCAGTRDAPVLRNRTLASRTATDVLLLTLPADVSTDAIATETLAHALRRAGAELLELDPRELAAQSRRSVDGRWQVAVWDTAPGGAGHVFELAERGAAWLNRARDVLYVDEQHHATCETACLRCLLSYDTQHHVRQGGILRKTGHHLVQQLLDKAPEPGIS